MDALIFQTLNGLLYRSAFLDAGILFFAEYLPFFLVAVALIRVVWLPGTQVQLKAVITAIGACLLAQVVTESIRFFYHHPRPFIALEIPHLFRVDAWSFPSGHAATFFALSTVVYHYDKRLGVIFFISSTLMGIARISAGVHYPSDIIAGAIVGIISGWTILKLLNSLLVR